MAKFVQRDYRRASNPFVAGQIATGKEVHIDTGRLTRGTFSSGSYQYGNLPFGYAVGWVDGTADVGGVPPAANQSVQNPYLLKGHVCARNYTQASNALTNFAGVAIRNVALPGAGTQVEGAEDGTDRDVDAYNLNDLVSIGAEGDFVVVCSSPVTIRSRVLVSTSTNTAGQFLTGTASATNPSVPGAIFMTDSVAVTPYGGSTAVNLAVVRIHLQPR